MLLLKSSQMRRMTRSTFSKGVMGTPWVIVLLLTTSSSTMFKAAESKLIYPKDTVDILNHMSQAITVHCVSRDNDLGLHILAPNEKYNFKLHRNFWGTNLFGCTFTSPSGRVKSLQVWSATVMKHLRCYGKCFWYVREDGFWVTDYNYKYEPLSEKFMVPW